MGKSKVRASTPVQALATTTPTASTPVANPEPGTPAMALATAQWRVAVAEQRFDEATAAWLAEGARMKAAKRSLEAAKMELESHQTGDRKARKIAKVFKEEPVG